MRNTRTPIQLERGHLDDHRDGFEDEQAADDGKHDLMLGGDGDCAERAAECQRSGVAHENHAPAGR